MLRGVPSALALRTLSHGATVQTRSRCLCPSQDRLLLPPQAPPGPHDQFLRQPSEWSLKGTGLVPTLGGQWAAAHSTDDRKLALAGGVV